MNQSARLRRLFGGDGRCFDVAVDHGFFNERAFLTGIEDMQRVVTDLVVAAPDAIQLSPGLAPLLQVIPGRLKPSLVLRTDIANIYGPTLPRTVFSRMIDHTVEQAIVLDAVCVVVNLLLLPEQPELYAQCIENIQRLKPQCDHYSMPLMIEPLAMQPNSQGAYMVDGDLDKILPLVRQAVELGADIIKADPCDEVSRYHEVIKVASGCPVLVRGGGKTSPEALLARTATLMQQGASGIVYGRNIIQHGNAFLMIRALMAVVHNDATPEDALAILSDARR